MRQDRLLLLLFATVLLPACAAGGQGAGGAAPDTLVAPEIRPARAAPAAAREDTDHLRQDGTSMNVSFGEPLGPEEVAQLLERHGVQAFALWIRVGEEVTRHEVLPERAAPDVVPMLWTRAVEGPTNWLCQLQVRYRAMWERGDALAPFPAEERDRIARMWLSEVEFARDRMAHQAQQRATILGAAVTGEEAALRRLAADPRIRSEAPAERRGELPYDPRAVHPRVASLELGEVVRRLQDLAGEPLPECREIDRNIRETGPTERLPERAANGHRVDGLQIRAETRVGPQRGMHAAAGVQTPLGITTVVTVTNTTDQRLELPVRGCTVMLLAYRSPDRAGAPAYDPSGSPGFGCAQDPYRVTLAPGETHSFETSAEARSILGDRNPPGRYYFAALLRLADRTLEIPAGEAELSPRVEGLSWRAESRVVGTAPRELHTTATVTNTSQRPIYIEYGACALQLRAYRTPQRSGEPVWRSELRRPPGSDSPYACPLYLATHTLAPGESFSPGEFQARIPFPEIHGDSLPDGRYYLTARLNLNFRWTEEFAAGELALVSRPDPLPAEQTIEGIRFRTRTERVAGAGSSLRLSLTITNTTTEPREVGGARSVTCPVGLYGYTTARERDTWYLEHRPLWTAPDCVLDLPQLRLAPGESRRFEARLSAPERRSLHLLAIVWADLTGPRGGPTRVVLPAGEMEGR